MTCSALTFNNIHIDDETLADDIKEFIGNIAPEQQKIVKLYNGKKPIFEAYSVDKQIKSLFGKTVNMPGGAYLVIEHTEAMHVVDVNSGGRKSKSKYKSRRTSAKSKYACSKRNCATITVKRYGRNNYC